MVESTFVAVGGWDGHVTKVHKKTNIGKRKLRYRTSQQRTDTYSIAMHGLQAMC